MGCWFSRSAAEAKPPPYDFYRSPPLRYMGYAGHLGSACLAIVPPNVAYIPQMAATVYMFSDIFQKTLESADRGDPQSRVIINAFDALIWQLLASAFIPGLVFNGIKSSSRQLFDKQSKGGSCKTATLPRSPFVARVIPCLLAILATPYIVGPIDRGVDYIMNSTYRKLTLSEDDLLDPAEREKRAKLKAKEAARIANQKAKEAKEKADQAARAEKEKLDKIKQQEKEAKEKARQKCLQEEKARKEKLAAEERALRERMKKEEAELKEKQAKLEQELKAKTSIKMECP